MGDIRTKAAAKLSVIRPGHWRNKWSSSKGWGGGAPGTIDLDEYTYLSAVVYPSRELAEELAARAMRENFAPGGEWCGQTCITYLGPVFFPANDPP